MDLNGMLVYLELGLLLHIILKLKYAKLNIHVITKYFLNGLIRSKTNKKTNPNQFKDNTFIESIKQKTKHFHPKMNAFPDTLVLKIQEFEQNGLVDTTLYILYDQSIQRFVLRGKRRDSEKSDGATYSFECDFAHELADFILFVIDKWNNRVSYILYNYDNLPLTSNEITYEFLTKYDTTKLDNVSYEIAGYDNLKLKRKELVSHLRMLRNVFNEI